MKRQTDLRTAGAAQVLQAGNFSGRPPVVSKAKWLSQDRSGYRLAKTTAATTTSRWPIILVLLLAVTYNGVLALLNAHGLYVSRSTVVVTEILLLISAVPVILSYGGKVDDRAPLFFAGVFIVNALAVSLFSGSFFIEMARNAAIIAVFTMLGARLSRVALIRSFLLSAAIVFIVLVVEMVSVTTYADLFSPATYFAQTRGIEPREFDDIGVFGNALGFEDRFSIIKIMDHRAASIFLEQVSLANFSVVLTIYLCCLWSSISKTQKLVLTTFIALLVITTASRAALGLVLIAPLAYWLAPKLSRFSSLAIMPAVFAIALIITTTRPPTGGDNLEGRLNYTMRHLSELDLPSLGGFQAPSAPTFADSGYMYVIVGSSLLGLLIYALFVSCIAMGRSDALKRGSLLLSLYVFGNLMVSGTSIFSIKTAALLWLLIGFLRASDAQGEGEIERQPAVAPAVIPKAPPTLSPLGR